MKNYPAILATLYNTVHCILPEKLEEIALFLEAAGAGATIPSEKERPQPYCLTPAGELAAMDRVTAAGSGDAFVAVLPLFGTMFQHGGMEMRASGGTSTEQFGQQFSALDANPAVKTIVIEAHTPGGQVYGTQEASDLIFAARQRGGTRIVTAGNSMIASAGTWASTAAHEVYMTPGGEIGSIGVVRMHRDLSKAEESAGVKTTLIATPPKKTAGHPYAPLDDDTHAEMQALVEGTMGRFVAAVARNRGVSEKVVRNDFGQGGMLRAQEAAAVGLIDGVATFRDVLEAEMSRLRAVGRGNAAANRRAVAIAENS